MSDTFCIMPWNSMAVTPDGRVTPCCAMKNTSKFHSPKIDDSARDTGVWKSIRQSMLEGRRLEDCAACYLKESRGAMSQRLIHTKDYRPSSTDKLPLERIEIAFSNLCNLACVGCDEETSSTFAAKIGKKPAYVSHGQLFDEIDLSSVKYLKVLGGEPLMEENKLIDLLRKLDLTKLEVEFITNGTRFPSDDLIKLLDQCNWVNIHVSMDGVPRVNEWCRWPVNHELVVSNMKRYRDWGKADLKIASLINIYNVWTLEEFHDYCEEVLPDWKILFNWVKSPPWQSISLIPHQLRPTFDRSDSVFEVTRQMMNSPVKSTLAKFKRNTDFLIKQRGDVYSIVPQLKRLEI